MIPVHLTLRNFLSYRDVTSLDFSHIRIACLSGDNGAGKSAILDAITWSLWGKTRASSDRDVVSMGTNEMEVTFTFQLGPREYRVFRRRSFARGPRGLHSVELFVREPGSDDWLPISGDTVGKTQDKIVALLNMEYETFVNSAFILQGRADSFTQKSPGDRKKILGEILNLQEYDELQRLARDDERNVSRRLEGMRGRIDTLAEQLAVRPVLLGELDVTSARLTDVSEKHDLAQELARSLALQLNAWERIQELLDAARARRAREQAAVERLATELHERARERDTLQDLMTQADEIEHGARALRHWRETVATFAAAVRQVNQQIAIQNDAEREIDGELARLLQERERQAQLAHSTGERLRKLERDAEQLDALQRETDLAASELARLPSTRAAIEQLTGERSELHAGNATLKARMQEIKDNLSRLQAGDADCPVCRRPLVPADRTRIADAWTSDGRLLGDQYRTNQQHMAELDARVRALNDDQARLVDIDRQNVARERQMQILETGLSDRDRMQAERDAATCEVERIDAVVAGGAFAHDARRRLHAAEETLAALNYDGAAHDAATAAERRYAAFEERKRDLDQARARLDGVEQAIASIVAQQDERGEAHDQARQEVVDFEAQLGSDPNLRARAQEAADDAEQLADEKHRLSGDLGGIERRLAHLDELQSERDELSRQSAALALDHGALRELVEAFGRNGIQAMIVDSVLPELEDETNTLLRRMSSGELSVAFRSQRQLISRDEVSETLDILIRDELGERSYALYSGGEAFRVNFAVRVALSKLLARRAGATIDLLVIDEGFGTQDSRGRDGLIEALRSVENDFRTILVITHIGEIRELFPTRIDIVKTERGSQISVN